jgi:hypothetical protein
MGWTYTTMPREGANAYLRSNFTWDNKEAKVKGEVLDCAIVRRKVAYLAVRHTNTETGASYVFAAVVLLNFIPKPRDGYGFGYKDMDEGMGPVEDDCPERILKLLTPIETMAEGGVSIRYASEWRSRCWSRIERAKARPTLRPGVVATLASPVNYRDGVQATSFTLRAHPYYPKRRQWVREDGVAVRVPKRLLDGATFIAAGVGGVA